MAKETAIINALWKARAFIQEAIHEDADYQRETFKEIDSLLADLDPQHHATIIDEENV